MRLRLGTDTLSYLRESVSTMGNANEDRGIIKMHVPFSGMEMAQAKESFGSCSENPGRFKDEFLKLTFVLTCRGIIAVLTRGHTLIKGTSSSEDCGCSWPPSTLDRMFSDLGKMQFPIEIPFGTLQTPTIKARTEHLVTRVSDGMKGGLVEHDNYKSKKVVWESQENPAVLQLLIRDFLKTHQHWFRTGGEKGLSGCVFHDRGCHSYTGT